MSPLRHELKCSYHVSGDRYHADADDCVELPVHLALGYLYSCFYVMIVLNGANTASTIPTLSTLPTAQDKGSSVLRTLFQRSRTK